MKKRIVRSLWLLLAAAILLSALPMTALAAVANYNIWVNGIQVTSANANDILGNGTARYYYYRDGNDEDGPGLLELTNATLTVGHKGNNVNACVFLADPRGCDISVVGTVTVTAPQNTDTNGISACIYSRTSLNITDADSPEAKNTLTLTAGRGKAGSFGIYTDNPGGFPLAPRETPIAAFSWISPPVPPNSPPAWPSSVPCP